MPNKIRVSSIPQALITKDRVYNRKEVMISASAMDVQMIASYAASGIKSGTGIRGGTGNILVLFWVPQ